MLKTNSAPFQEGTGEGSRQGESESYLSEVLLPRIKRSGPVANQPLINVGRLTATCPGMTAFTCENPCAGTSSGLHCVPYGDGRGVRNDNERRVGDLRPVTKGLDGVLDLRIAPAWKVVRNKNSWHAKRSVGCVNAPMVRAARAAVMVVRATIRRVA